jgi:hypothetical protein
VTEPREYTLELPAGMLLINVNEGLHWREINKRRQIIRRCTEILARNQKIPALARVHITGRLHFPDARRRDANNWADSAKPAVDALVTAGVLEDDDSTRVLGPDMRIGEKRPRAQLVLEIREVLT